MPKRKRVRVDAGRPAGETFSLMDGKVDVLEGLVMHREVIGGEFENELISFVQTQCARGRNGELKKPTYLRASGARSRGNQREAIMYGGFFDFNRARPGKRGLVPPFPPILEKLVDHLVSNNYLPRDVRPDSCIINQYDAGDCIPPHVDHPSYYRPISTLSLLGEEPMLVGTRFRTVRSCTWAPVLGRSVPLPRRSLLVLGGNAGNVSKHCISACGGPRISITLRKQPPPDWRPDRSELVGKGGKRTKRRRGDDERGERGEGGGSNGDNEERPKKKALSGSAKRRKKMLKMMGRKDETSQSNSNNRSNNSTNDSANNNASKRGNPSKSAEKMSGDRKLAVESSDCKKLAKQARRNARRLEKKRAAAAAAARM